MNIFRLLVNHMICVVAIPIENNSQTLLLPNESIQTDILGDFFSYRPIYTQWDDPWHQWNRQKASNQSQQAHSIHKDPIDEERNESCYSSSNNSDGSEDEAIDAIDEDSTQIRGLLSSIFCCFR